MVSFVILACWYSGVESFFSCSMQMSTTSGGELGVVRAAISFSMISKNSWAGVGFSNVGGIKLNRIGKVTE